MVEPTLEKKNLNKFNTEDKVLVTFLVITIFFSVLLPILWFLEEPIIVPPPVISIFLGISVSILLYRFLGGVQSATLTVGALKVTGTTAVLISVAMWSNNELKGYVPSSSGKNAPFDISRHVIPNKNEWYATQKINGLPITLSFPNYNQTHKPPNYKEIGNQLKNRILRLKSNNGSVVAYMNNGTHLLLGKIQGSELNEAGYYKNYSVDFVPYRVVSFTSTQRVDISTKLPFVIETKGFYENYTVFLLISKADGRELHEGQIYLRNAEVVNVDGKYYLISVVQVNHAPENTEAYAKIYIAEIRINLK